MRQELSAKRWRDVSVQVRGFVRPMSDYMAASDCIITKAGPGTVMEAASQGLPVMLSGYLPPQEAGNVDTVVRGGFGAYSRKPTVIGRTVCNWLVRARARADARALGFGRRARGGVARVRFLCRRAHAAPAMARHLHCLVPPPLARPPARPSRPPASLRPSIRRPIRSCSRG